MKKWLIPALLAFVAAAIISFVFGFIGGFVHDEKLVDIGKLLGGLIGAFVFYFLYAKSGNRAVAKADEATRHRALQFACPPGKALLYLARTGFKGSAIGVDIAVDGRTLAQLKAPMFTCLELAPGPHRLQAEVGGRSALHPAGAESALVLEAGTVTLLHIGMKTGLTRSQLVFEPWTLDTAQQKLASIGMVLPEPVPAAA